MKHREICRRGVRILKSVCAWPGKSEYEYFGYSLDAAHSARPLGRACRVGNWQYYALRNMRTGFEHRGFNSLLDAEEWIAACDSWGELERLPSGQPEH